MSQKIKKINNAYKIEEFFMSLRIINHCSVFLDVSTLRQKKLF